MTGDSGPQRLPQWQRLGLVFLGGTIGTAIRAGIGVLVPVLAVPGNVTFPIATMAINVIGSFLLGYVVEAIAASRASSRHAEALRVGLGTGVLGGFTTYSAVCLDTVSLASVDPMLGIIYAGGTLLCGVIASGIGIAIAAHRRVDSADDRGPSIVDSP